VQLDVGADEVGVTPGARRHAVELADQHGCRTVAEVDARERGMVLEARLAVARRLGLGHPELDAVQVAAERARGLLRVGDAPAGGHEVELSGSDQLLRPEAVAVQQLARHQPGDGVQPQVRVGADVDPSALGDRSGPEVVGEAPGADGASPVLGQCPADLLPADLGCPARRDVHVGL
jgi:hypothetical protein